MNLFNRIRGYFIYRKVIKQNWGILSGPSFKMTKDWFNNVGTVINMPENILDWENTLGKTIIIDYVKKCEKQFYQMNIGDMAKPVETVKIDDFNYKVVFGYKYLKNWQIAVISILKYVLYATVIVGLLKIF